MNVVLVHGFLNRGGILHSLARGLTRAGHRCHVPNLQPCDGRSGLPALAGKLADFVDSAVEPEEPLALVGFSMGALISRYYLQELGAYARARAYFSIAGPHAGTRAAYLYPSLGVSQMRPGSRFLNQLSQSADRLRGLSITCYWTPFDLMIRPVSSAQWAVGEAVCIRAPLHSLLVFDSRLHRDIERRLARLQG